MLDSKALEECRGVGCLMTRKRRVPEVLWRLFHRRARTLVEIILDIVPPPPAAASECRCRGIGCLVCSGDQAMRFLIRPEDPSEYRRLLTRSFAVVSDNAPLLGVVDPQCRWSQREIVTRSIEMILYEQPSSSNLICSGYDKVCRLSAMVDILTSSAWVLLLTRIGDALMMYILKYTSLFLPLTQKKHHQITGFPISDLNLKFSRAFPVSISRGHPLTFNGKKRKKPHEEDSIPGKRLCKCPSDFELSSDSVKFSYESNEESLPEKSGECPKPNAAKRSRLYSWQRQRKRKQFSLQGVCSFNVPSVGDNSNGNGISINLQNDCYPSSCYGDTKNASQCLCCQVFQNLQKLAMNSEITRNIFYRLGNSSSMLSKKHILNRLKPDETGATLLFKNIFGIPGIDKRSPSQQCFHKRSSLVQSDCLYHCFIKNFKHMIRKTQRCQYQRLLEKHCSIPLLCERERNSTVFKKSDFVDNATVTGCNGLAQIEGKVVGIDDGAKHKMASGATNMFADPSNNYCLKKQVVSFVWASCRRIVPAQLLGAPSNWRVLRKNISKFIQLRKFEKFSLKQSLHKLKLSKFPLLSYKNFCSRFSSDGTGHNHWSSGNLLKECSERLITDTTRHSIFECWMFWFFAHLVTPLIQANFYVTESENEKQEVFYFRKCIWEKQLRKTEKCLKDHSFHQLSYASTHKILRNRSFGFSRVRLRPKQKGFRVLANLQASSRMRVSPSPCSIQLKRNLTRKACHKFGNVKFELFKPVNTALHDLHVILKGIQTKEPDKLGGSVFDYNDVHRKLVPFLLRLKNGSATFPNVFIVVSDVSKAFDSINQDKLFSVMKDVTSDNEFILEKHTRVICTKKSLKVHKLVLAHQDTVTDFESPCPRVPSQSFDCVLVKKELSKKVWKEQFNMVLEEHIKHNVVQLDHNFYLQHVGIPQGSVLSSLLCSFYYGHMERQVLFPFLDKVSEDFSKENNKFGVSTSSGDHTDGIHGSTQCLLLRFIDDFLFISTSKKQASMFFSRLERGVREYNCCMNNEKYGFNFNMNHSERFYSNRLYVGKDGISFLCWSGLLVNCHTLEIQADYTRYINSRLSSTLTISSEGKVGQKLKAKLCNYLRPKCHPIFYDSNINSRAVVRLNIYQVFLLCAMKFLCYISNLTTVPKFDINFYMDSINSSLRYMNKLIKRQKHAFNTDVAFRPKYEVNKQEVFWLGLHAYSQVIQKKQSQHKKLLHLLKSELKIQGSIEPLPTDMKYATDEAHSSALWSIKY